MQLLERFAAAALSAAEFHVVRFWRVWLASLGALAVVVFAAYAYFAAPAAFVPGTIVVVPKGASAAAVAELLADAQVVRHPDVFRYLVRATGEADRIQSGAYQFSDRQTVFGIALRLSRGEFGIPPARLTFVEGMTARMMAARIAAAMPEISVDDFISAGQPYEGYLFPDTYFIPPSADAESVVGMMRANFDDKMAAVSVELAASGRPLSDAITMASILEREARTVEEKRMIAGILWNRIERGMPLQVDAVFGYIFGRETYSPSFEDLAVDSPYNTYTHRGLPPGPISNPGLASIRAALDPIKSNYLFYLTGRDGVTRYAKTYQEQLANQRKYLR